MERSPDGFDTRTRTVPRPFGRGAWMCAEETLPSRGTFDVRVVDRLWEVAERRMIAMRPALAMGGTSSPGSITGSLGFETPPFATPLQPRPGLRLPSRGHDGEHRMTPGLERSEP